jgi:hypothetical protein
MTTPRVTEIPLELVPLEPDPFTEGLLRGTAAQRRLSARGARERQVEMVRCVMRIRTAFARGRHPA